MNFVLISLHSQCDDDFFFSVRTTRMIRLGHLPLTFTVTRTDMTPDILNTPLKQQNIKPQLVEMS